MDISTMDISKIQIYPWIYPKSVDISNKRYIFFSMDISKSWIYPWIHPRRIYQKINGYISDISLSDTSILDISFLDISVVDTVNMDISAMDIDITDISAMDVIIMDISLMDISAIYEYQRVSACPQIINKTLETRFRPLMSSYSKVCSSDSECTTILEHRIPS